MYLCVRTTRINPFAVNIINGSDEEATLFQFASTFKSCWLYHVVLCGPNEIMRTYTRTDTTLLLDFIFEMIFLMTKDGLLSFSFANDFRLTIIYFEISTN